MKRHLQCAEQQVSRSNLTKDCACHAERLACFILVTYETSFTMRGATGVTIQPHQIHPRHIWNVIYIARSNRCHDPTSPKTAPATKLQNFREIFGKQVKRHLQCGDDPTMIRPWNRQSATRLATEVTIFEWKNTTVRAPAIVQKLTKCCACHTKSHSNFTKCWTRHKKVTLEFHQVLHLPRKVRLELHQILPLSRKVSLEHIAPGPKSVTWTSPSAARATKSDTWTSPSAAPATKSLNFTKCCTCHENRRLSFTSYTAPFKKNDLPNISGCHQKYGPCHIWNLIYNAESNRTRARRYYSLTLLFCDSTILLLFYSVPLLLCVSSFLWLYYLWADKVVLFCDSTSLSLLHSSTLLYCCSFTLLFFFSTFLLRYHSLILLISYSTILWVYFFVITLFFVLLVFYPSFLWLYYSFILPFCDCTRLLL